MITLESKQSEYESALKELIGSNWEIEIHFDPLPVVMTTDSPTSNSHYF